MALLSCLLFLIFACLGTGCMGALYGIARSKDALMAIDTSTGNGSIVGDSLGRTMNLSPNGALSTASKMMLVVADDFKTNSTNLLGIRLSDGEVVRNFKLPFSLSSDLHHLTTFGTSGVFLSAELNSSIPGLAIYAMDLNSGKIGLFMNLTSVLGLFNMPSSYDPTLRAWWFTAYNNRLEPVLVRLDLSSAKVSVSVNSTLVLMSMDYDGLTQHIYGVAAYQPDPSSNKVVFVFASLHPATGELVVKGFLPDSIPFDGNSLCGATLDLDGRVLYAIFKGPLQNRLVTISLADGSIKDNIQSQYCATSLGYIA